MISTLLITKDTYIGFTYMWKENCSGFDFQGEQRLTSAHVSTHESD